jgi:hypothetical protein
VAWRYGVIVVLFEENLTCLITYIYQPSMYSYSHSHSHISHYNHGVTVAGALFQTVVPVPLIVAVVAAYKLYIFPAPQLCFASPLHGIVHAFFPTSVFGSGVGATMPA